MTDFPPLPEPAHRGPPETGDYFSAFTAQQMRDYVAADRAQRQAGQGPVAIVAVTPNGGATIGWYPGHIAKHNDLLYAAPPPAAQPEREPLTEEQIDAAIRGWFAEDWAIDKARGLLADLGVKPAQVEQA